MTSAAKITVCNRTCERLITHRIGKLASLVAAYEWIIDAYVSDFFTKEFWSRLPPSLCKYFDETDCPDLAWLLSGSVGQDGQTCYSAGSSLPPLSLLALHKCTSMFALPRAAVDTASKETAETIVSALASENLITSVCQAEESDSRTKIGLSVPTVAGSVPRYKNGQNMDMQHIFRKHVKPKKQHEINNLGQVVSVIAAASNSGCVVDVGAGLGHLARVLTFQHNLKVTTVEATGGHGPRAVEIDMDLRKNIHKAKMKKTAPSSAASVSDADCDTELPSHVICTVQPDIAASQFLDIVTNRASSEPSQNTNEPTHSTGPKTHLDSKESVSDSNFVLAGLHACGDLTPTLLRVFINCPAARSLASVACCYMKMQAASSPSILNNFPMSSHLQKSELTSLSYEAREMACHFADAYRQRLLDNPPHLKIHGYRAALQLLVTSVDPTFKSGQTRLITKKGADRSFREYVSDNLAKLNLSVDCVPPSLMAECEDLAHKSWRRVVAFYTLRLSLAPIVESLILLDRCLFLLEHGVPSVLVPIFEPSISPRNFALLAMKHCDNKQ